MCRDAVVAVMVEGYTYPYSVRVSIRDELNSRWAGWLELTGDQGLF